MPTIKAGVLPPQPRLKARMLDTMAARDETVATFCERLYGRDDNGHIKGTGPLYATWKGTTKVSLRWLKEWEEGLDLAPGELVALIDEQPETRTLRREIKTQVAETPAQTPARYLLEHGAHTTGGPMIASAKTTPPQFSLVVDQDGRATLRLNVIDVPLETAMQVVTTLTTIGLLRGSRA